MPADVSRSAALQAQARRDELVAHAARLNPVFALVARLEPRVVGQCVFHGGRRDAVCAAASAWCACGADPRTWRVVSVPRAPNAVAYATPHHVEVDLDSVAPSHAPTVVAWLTEVAATRDIVRGARILCVHSAHRADRAALFRLASSCVLVATTTRPDAGPTRDLPGLRVRVPAPRLDDRVARESDASAADAGLSVDETVGLDFVRVAAAATRHGASLADAAATARVVADLDAALLTRPNCEERLIRAAARALRDPGSPERRRRTRRTRASAGPCGGGDRCLASLRS